MQTAKHTIGTYLAAAMQQTSCLKQTSREHSNTETLKCCPKHVADDSCKTFTCLK